MAKHGCESGRHNLSFVSHSTFAKAPIGPNLADFEADFAVLGVSNDMGTQYRPGARFGPRGIREASTLVFFGHSGACDFEHDINYLPSLEVTIVDIGHVNIVHTDMEQSNANTEQAVRQILTTGATSILLGGDHSIHDPSMAAITSRSISMGSTPPSQPALARQATAGFCITAFSKSCNSSSKRARLSALVWSR